MYENKDLDLMTKADVRSYLKCSKGFVDTLFKSPDFPQIVLNEEDVVVRRGDFLKYFEKWAMKKKTIPTSHLEKEKQRHGLREE